MKRLPLGHMLGYTALTVILTAGAAQSLAGSNTVFGDDIVDGQVGYADIKNNAVGGAKILDGAVTGTKIFNNSVTGTDVNESTLLLTCPTGMVRVGDVCYTTQLRELATFVAALDDCLDEHRRLPSVGEARLAAIDADESSLTWTDNTYTSEGIRYATIVNKDSTIFGSDTTGTEKYRCVTTVGANP